jgi:hypothetical protein
MYVWSGSAWVSVATEVESLANFATQSYADNTPGSRLIVPSSVSVGSGSGSVSTQGAVTFSGASSVSVNNCFSSIYDNYRIVMNHDSSAAAVGFNMRMRAAGTDNTSVNYVFASGSATQAGTFVGGSVGTSALDTSWTLTPISGTYSSSTIFDILLPFSSAYQTNFSSTSFYFDSLSNYRAGFGAGATSVTTSYDGITFYPASGTITGTVRVYGYKN